MKNKLYFPPKFLGSKFCFYIQLVLVEISKEMLKSQKYVVGNGSTLIAFLENLDILLWYYTKTQQLLLVAIWTLKSYQ